MSAIDSEGRTIWIADAHRDGKRFIVRADEMKTLITLFAGITLIACASGHKRPTMAALNSAAVFHAEDKAKPLPMAARR